jgi:hypothetical protein
MDASRRGAQVMAPYLATHFTQCEMFRTEVAKRNKTSFKTITSRLTSWDAVLFDAPLCTILRATVLYIAYRIRAQRGGGGRFIFPRSPRPASSDGN